MQAHGCMTSPCPLCNPQPAPIYVYPPNGMPIFATDRRSGGHRYVIGENMAVCERCDKVLRFDEVVA